MRFQKELVKGKLVKRYKRFLADIELENGEVVTAHCPNSGRMYGLDSPGFPVWLTPKDNADEGKLKFSWELVKADGELVGINTNRPNAIVTEAIKNGFIPELAGYESLRREVKYGTNSRIDILLEDPKKGNCYVEIKNVHLKRGRYVEFPDAVTERGAKHMTELAKVAKAGDRAVVFFLAQRQDGEAFKVAGDIDHAYEDAFKKALKSGVEALCYRCKMSENEITIDEPIPVL